MASAAASAFADRRSLSLEQQKQSANAKHKPRTVLLKDGGVVYGTGGGQRFESQAGRGSRTLEQRHYTFNASVKYPPG
uniref:Uncharacterized protein n=1 Tax=Anguilla anguilla TaxID=7936 RepID=A0A0E9WQ98_ANGAN